MTLAVGTRIDPPLAGASTTNGTTGRAVTLAYEVAAATYDVNITPTAQPSGTFGEYWIGNKTVTGFTVYNDGAAGLAFTYSVTRY